MAAAVDYGGIDISVEAGADLSTYQYRPVYIDTSGQAQLLATAGAKMSGILQNKPDAQGKAARVRISGTSFMKANAAIEEGVEVAAVVTSGLLATASAGQYICGQAITAAAAQNDLFTAQILNYQKNA